VSSLGPEGSRDETPLAVNREECDVLATVFSPGPRPERANDQQAVGPLLDKRGSARNLYCAHAGRQLRYEPGRHGPGLSTRLAEGDTEEDGPPSGHVSHNSRPLGQSSSEPMSRIDRHAGDLDAVLTTLRLPTPQRRTIASAARSKDQSM